MRLQEYLDIQNEELKNFGKDPDMRILAAFKSIENQNNEDVGDEDVDDKDLNKKKLKNCYKKLGLTVTVEQFIDVNSYVVNRGNGRYELFILGSYKYYRKRFQQFLKIFYNFPRKFNLPREMNVDHVFNKERAKNYFIRMMLLEEKANKGWGSSYEKLNTQLDDRYNKDTGDGLIYLDYVVFMKMLGLYPIKKGDVTGIEDVTDRVNEYYDILVKELGFSLLEEPFKQFLRAEFNFILNGIWSGRFK